MIGPDDGILIDSNNEALISQGLEEIYDGISNFIGKEIRARAMEKFSAEKVAESHLKLYEEVI
jgi:glycosyltransferase involved in cell wall biosynthesis